LLEKFACVEQEAELLKLPKLIAELQDVASVDDDLTSILDSRLPSFMYQVVSRLEAANGGAHELLKRGPLNDADSKRLGELVDSLRDSQGFAAMFQNTNTCVDFSCEERYQLVKARIEADINESRVVLQDGLQTHEIVRGAVQGLDSRSVVWKHVSEEVKDSVTNMLQSYHTATEEATRSFECKHGEGFRARDLSQRRILVEFLINASQLFQESLLVAQQVSLTREAKQIAFLANRLPDQLIHFCREKVEYCCQTLHQQASSKDANMVKRIEF